MVLCKKNPKDVLFCLSDDSPSPMCRLTISRYTTKSKGNCILIKDFDNSEYISMFFSMSGMYLHVNVAFPDFEETRHRCSLTFSQATHFRLFQTVISNLIKRAERKHRNEQILLFPECFQNTCTADS